MGLDKAQPLRQLLQLAAAAVVVFVVLAVVAYYYCYLIFIVRQKLASPLEASERALLAIERYSNYRTKKECKASTKAATTTTA